jgi:hypothetical protein
MLLITVVQVRVKQSSVLMLTKYVVMYDLEVLVVAIPSMACISDDIAKWFSVICQALLWNAEN